MRRYAQPTGWVAMQSATVEAERGREGV
jgi:hypothetical protein